MRQVYCFVVNLVMLLTVIFPAGMAANTQSAMNVISSGHYGKGHRYNIQGWEMDSPPEVSNGKLFVGSLATIIVGVLILAYSRIYSSDIPIDSFFSDHR